MRRLGIVIPAYNVAFPLKRLLKQVGKQLTDDVAVVVVDDGSADDTLQVAKQFESEAVRVLHKENGGVGSARNLGKRNATRNTSGSLTRMTESRLTPSPPC